MIEMEMTLGLVVERRRSSHPWSVEAGQEFSWLPVQVLSEPPATASWTALDGNDELMRFYAGQVILSVYSTDTANYRDNLASGLPKLWVAMLRSDGDPALDIVAISADPAEGEAWTEAGRYLVETLDMRDEIAAELARFIADHHVERPIIKRKRDRAPPDVRWRAEPTVAERAAVDDPGAGGS